MSFLITFSMDVRNILIIFVKTRGKTVTVVELQACQLDRLIEKALTLLVHREMQ